MQGLLSYPFTKSVTDFSIQQFMFIIVYPNSKEMECFVFQVNCQNIKINNNGQFRPYCVQILNWRAHIYTLIQAVSYLHFNLQLHNKLLVYILEGRFNNQQESVLCSDQQSIELYSNDSLSTVYINILVMQFSCFYSQLCRIEPNAVKLFPRHFIFFVLNNICNCAIQFL